MNDADQKAVSNSERTKMHLQFETFLQNQSYLIFYTCDFAVDV